MKYVYLKVRIKVEDLLATGSFAKAIAAIYLAASYLFYDPIRRLQSLAAWFVRTGDIGNLSRVMRTASPVALKVINDSKYVQTPGGILRRSIILKESLPCGERGVLLVSFEKELEQLVLLEEFGQLEKQYKILFLPTWQPFLSLPIFYLAARARETFWIMPSCSADEALCPEVARLCRPLPFQASSWVNPEFYEKLPKSIDLVMIANFSKYKRHWRLFEALNELPQEWRIVLAGRPLGGRTSSSLMEEARAYNVEERFELIENPDDDEIARILSRSMLCCALSRKEGSYVTVVEALMADTPVGMYRDAIIGSKEYINDKTGVLFDPDRKLSSQIIDFFKRIERPRPAEWARQNIAADENCVKLNKILKEQALRDGEVWTKDIESFYCRNFVFYYYGGYVTEMKYKSVYDGFSRMYKISIQRPDFHPKKA